MGANFANNFVYRMYDAKAYYKTNQKHSSIALCSLGVCWCVAIIVFSVYGFVFVSNYFTPIGCILGECEQLDPDQYFYAVNGTLDAGQWKYYSLETGGNLSGFQVHIFSRAVEDKGKFCFASSRAFLPSKCENKKSVYCKTPANIVVGIQNSQNITDSYNVGISIENPKESMDCVVGYGIHLSIYFGIGAGLIFTIGLPVTIMTILLLCILCNPQCSIRLFGIKYLEPVSIEMTETEL
jgi:hypothetical protein